jgi:ethanolamine utilization microcompartment shell protein EutL
VHEQDVLEHAVLPAERAVALLLPAAPRSAMVALAAALHEEAVFTFRYRIPALHSLAALSTCIKVSGTQVACCSCCSRKGR